MFIRVEPIVDTKWLDLGKTDINVHGVITGSMSISISVKVIDTEFEETVGELSSCHAIIKAYEKRSRNPAGALALLIRDNPGNRELFNGHPVFDKYVREVEKLLLLM